MRRPGCCHFQQVAGTEGVAPHGMRRQGYARTWKTLATAMNMAHHKTGSDRSWEAMATAQGVVPPELGQQRSDRLLKAALLVTPLAVQGQHATRKRTPLTSEMQAPIACDQPRCSDPTPKKRAPAATCAERSETWHTTSA